MIKLLIDTASSRIILGLFQDEKILSEINEENDNQLSVRIFPLIDKLFGLSEIKPEMVDEIIVVNGPGSFTGVRIGVTIAKTYAWALHKKITIISELQMMASTKTSAKYRIAMIDARRNAVYAGIYDENLKIEFSKKIINSLVDSFQQFNLENNVKENSVKENNSSDYIK